MSAPRIPTLSVDEAKQRAAEHGLPDAFADLSIFRILLRHPLVAKQLGDLLIALLFRGALDERLRELIIMRIGWATGSVYEWTQHWRIARELGVSEADLLALRDWREHEDWGDAERAVLAATDETIEGGAISPATWSACAKALPSEAEQLELVAAIGTWRMVSALLRSLDVPLEEGVAAWPPDGRKPPAAD